MVWARGATVNEKTGLWLWSTMKSEVSLKSSDKNYPASSYFVSHTRRIEGDLNNARSAIWFESKMFWFLNKSENTQVFRKGRKGLHTLSICETQKRNQQSADCKELHFSVGMKVVYWRKRFRMIRTGFCGLKYSANKLHQHQMMPFVEKVCKI